MERPVVEVETLDKEERRKIGVPQPADLAPESPVY